LLALGQTPMNKARTAALTAVRTSGLAWRDNPSESPPSGEKKGKIGAVLTQRTSPAPRILVRDDAGFPAYAKASADRRFTQNLCGGHPPRADKVVGLHLITGRAHPCPQNWG